MTNTPTFYAWVRSFKKRTLPPRTVGNYAGDWLGDACYDEEMPKSSDIAKIFAYMKRIPCDSEAHRAAVDAWCLWWNETHPDEDFQLTTKSLPEHD